MTSYYPLTFEPVLKDYIWGGRNLETAFGRNLPPDTNIAESWEIAAHKDGQSIVTNGEYAGMTLSAVHEKLGIGLIGTRNQWAQDRDKFPLLVKLLDANRPLSVQVHPDDAYALANEGNELGKTEMWYVLAAEPDAAVIYGVTKGNSAETFQQAVADGNLEPHMHYLPVKAGDFVDVPAGTLHAILGGILIAEIQQNSNTTYRVYDWNRMGHDGKPRPLHLEQALATINFDQVEPAKCEPLEIISTAGVTRSRLVSNRYFTVEKVEIEAGTSYQGQCDGSTFEIWGIIEGTAKIKSANAAVALEQIQFCLLPAKMGSFEINSQSATTFLRAYVDA